MTGALQYRSIHKRAISPLQPLFGDELISMKPFYNGAEAEAELNQKLSCSNHPGHQKLTANFACQTGFLLSTPKSPDPFHLSRVRFQGDMPSEFQGGVLPGPLLAFAMVASRMVTIVPSWRAQASSVPFSVSPCQKVQETAKPGCHQ